jgi:hypothetical protein
MVYAPLYTNDRGANTVTSSSPSRSPAAAEALTLTPQCVQYSVIAMALAPPILDDSVITGHRPSRLVPTTDAPQPH